MSEPIYRYRAVKPFEEEQSALFFGRKAETAQLAALIFAEKLTVLYGKSGYGKSSLLNAGILPLLKTENAQGPRRYVPVPVRFQNAEKGGEGLFEKFRFHFGQATKKADLTASQPLTTLPDTLWGLFKSVEVAENTTFVLLFDQFEEFFSYPPEQQAAFKEQLSELLYTAYPAFVREQRSRLSESDLEWLSASLDVRAVFAIRADRLSDLDQLSKPLAAILKNRMELGALDAEQAELAIVEPARLANTEGRFRTGPFVYQPEALRRILAALKGAESQRIESFVLQIVCFSIEKTAERQGLTEISPDNLPDFREVFDTYYREQLAELPDDQRATAAQVLEYGLLYYDPATGSAHRRSVDSAELQAAPTLLEALERTYLVRREVNSFGRFSYEISHDTLIEPILKARKEKDAAAEELRKEQERLEAEARALEAEERVKHETALREGAERQRRRATWWAWGAGVAAVVAALVAFWAFSTLKKLERETNPKTAIFQEALKDWEKRKQTSSKHYPLEGKEYTLEGDNWKEKVDSLSFVDKGLLTLPDEVYACKNLRAICLAGNVRLQLSEVLPRLAQLKSLTTLDLSGNHWDSLPPEIGTLTNLTTLYLRSNKLKSLPRQIGALDHLKILYLDGNELDSLPPEIGGMKSLTTLSLSSNRLRNLPTEIGNLQSLTTLNLNYNRLNNSLSQIWALKSLTSLSLNGNDSERLPPEIRGLASLEMLDFSWNKLTSLPPEIGSLTNLKTLYLPWNKITSLPPEIGDLKHLMNLDLRNNELSIFPPEIGGLENLKTLDLSSNKLISLPPQIRGLKNLVSLNLWGNQLSRLPAEIGELTALTNLKLAENKLTRLPAEIGKLTLLNELYLTGNQLSSLPHQITRLKSLRSLFLKGNPIPISQHEKIKQMLPGCGVYFEDFTF